MSIFKGTTEPKKIYLWVEAQPITTAGIYHNSDLGLISLSSDGTNWTTIADKNLGATSTDITSADSYGNYYQRGNNYGFPNSGTVSTSSTTVNAGSYGPNNYYNNSTFRTGSYWDTSYNANLWGDTTNTNAARKGPCDDGYHIPSQSEASSLINLGITLGAWTSSLGNNMKDILFMPYGGTRSTSGSAGAQGLYGYYWTSTKYSNNNGYCIEFYSSVNHIGNAAKTYGMKIRPFKNEAVQPRVGWNTIYDPNWTITFNSLGNTVVVDSNTLPNATLHYSTTKAANCTSTDTSVATVTGSGNSITITVLGAGTCSIYEGTFFVCQLTVS